MAGDASKALSNDVLWGGGRSPFSISYGKMMMWFFLVSDALTFSGLLTAYGFVRHSTTEVWPIGEEVFRALPGLTGSYPLIYVALMTAILIFQFRDDGACCGSRPPDGQEGGDQVVVPHRDRRRLLRGQPGMGVEPLHPWRRWLHHHQHRRESTGCTTIPMTPMTRPTHLASTWCRPPEGHYLIPAEGAHHLDHSESLKLWNERANYVDGANMTHNEYGPPQYANFFFFITGFHGFHVFSGVIINLIVLIMVIQGVFHRRGHYEMVEKAGLYWHFVDLVWVFVFTFFYLL
jgi:cytochrome c oxidase subunit 3